MPIALLFASISLSYDLPPNLLSSICYVESTHNIHAIHLNDRGSNSVGVCQLKLKTARWLGFKGTEAELMKPDINIKYAAIYLRYQIRRHKQNLTLAVISYNRGNAKNLTHTKYSDTVMKQYRGTLWGMK